MKVLLLVVLSFIGGGGGKGNSLSRPDEINKVKQSAEEAFVQQDYGTAITHYTYLLDSMEVDEDAVKLNLAHAYLQSDAVEEARSKYLGITATSADKRMKSTAYQQLGVMAHEQDNNIDQALLYLKQALRQNPGNEEARYNYELLKKLKEQEEEEEDKDKEDEQEDDKEQKPEEEQEQEEEKKEEQEGEQEPEEEDGEQEDKEGEEEGQEEEQEGQDGEEKEEQEGKDGEEKEEQEGEEGSDTKEGEKEGKEGEEEKDGKGEEETDLGKDEGDKKEGEEGQEGEEGDAEGEEQKGGQEGKDGEQGEGAPKTPEERLREMNIPPEKAKMILEAMRNNEVQYLQQIRRKGKKQQDRTKPDW